MSFHNTILYASFDPKPFQDPESYYYNLKQTKETIALNTAPTTITFRISSGLSETNNDVLKFTSNGILGFGTPLTAFEIPKINFVNQDIYFTATLTSLSSLSSIPRKSADKLLEQTDLLITHNQEDQVFLISSNEEKFITDITELDVNLVLSDDTILPSSSANFITNFSSNSSLHDGGYFKGILRSSLSANNARILVKYATEFFTVSGYSPTFDILPNKGRYDVRKVGEDYNQTQAYKDLIFQEILNDQPQLFDSFLGQIVGDNKSSPDTLGIKQYAKIKNFVSNVTDIDYTDINALKSVINELGIPYEQYQQNFPPSLSRLVDILSVGLSKQLGSKNQYQDNFDDRGFTGKTVYGTNKGFELDIYNSILETGDRSEDIIALEKFSNEFKLVNTNVISATNVDYISAAIDVPGVSAYPLSAYNDTWGWGLVLPHGFAPSEIERFYKFYQYTPGIQGSYLQKFIDFNNPLNTYLNPISSIPWTGKYSTTNRPGGPPWTFNGLDTGVNLTRTGKGTKFDFGTETFTVEMNTDLSIPDQASYSQYIAGSWGVSKADVYGFGWLLMLRTNGSVACQYSQDGTTHMTTSFIASAFVPQRFADFKFERVGNTSNFYFDGVQVDPLNVSNLNSAPDTIFSPDINIQIGGDVTTLTSEQSAYRFNGTINNFKLTKGIPLTGEVLIDYNANTSTSTPLTSYDQYASKWGIAESVISHNLYSNLGLLSGT